MALNILRGIGQVFFRMCLYLNLLCIFLLINLGLCVIGRKRTVIKCNFPIMLTVLRCPHDLWLDVYLDYLAEVVFVRFPHWKWLLFPYSTWHSLEISHYVQTTRKECGSWFCWIQNSWLSDFFFFPFSIVDMPFQYLLASIISYRKLVVHLNSVPLYTTCFSFAAFKIFL